MYKSNNISKDFSEWENDDVNSWLESIKLNNLIEYSKRNEITGYDLCVLSNEEIKKILGINSLKDLNILSKNIKIKLLDLINITICYDNKNLSFQIDHDLNYSIDILSQSLKDLYKVKENIYFLNSDNQLLASNCKIVQLLILNPRKFKILKLIKNIDSFNESSKSYSSFNKPYEENLSKYKKFEENPEPKIRKQDEDYEIISNSKEDYPLKYKDNEQFSQTYKLEADNYNFKSFEKYSNPEKYLEKYKKEDVSGSIENTNPNIYDKKKLDTSPGKFGNLERFANNTNNSIETNNNYMSITDNTNLLETKKDKNYGNNLNSPTLSYNYTDRLKEEFNNQRQRFASEKRTYTRGAGEGTKEAISSGNYDYKYSFQDNNNNDRKAKVAEIKRDYKNNISTEGIKKGGGQSNNYNYSSIDSPNFESEKIKAMIKNNSNLKKN